MDFEKMSKINQGYDSGFQTAFNPQRQQYEERIKQLEEEKQTLADENKDLTLEVRVFTQTIQAFKEMEIREKIAKLLLAEE